MIFGNLFRHKSHRVTSSYERNELGLSDLPSDLVQAAFSKLPKDGAAGSSEVRTTRVPGIGGVRLKFDWVVDGPSGAWKFSKADIVNVDSFSNPVHFDKIPKSNEPGAGAATAEI